MNVKMMVNIFSGNSNIDSIMASKSLRSHLKCLYVKRHFHIKSYDQETSVHMWNMTVFEPIEAFTINYWDMIFTDICS